MPTDTPDPLPSWAQRLFDRVETLEEETRELREDLNWATRDKHEH